MSNSGTNNVALDPAVDVDASGRNLVLEAINAIEVVEAREVIEHAIVRLAAQSRCLCIHASPGGISCPAIPFHPANAALWEGRGKVVSPGFCTPL